MIRTPPPPFAAFLLALVLGAVEAKAAIITDPSETDYIQAVSTFETYGDGMVGMAVSASFADGVTETLSWEATAFRAGGVFGTDWSLSVIPGSSGLPLPPDDLGSTYFELWSFENNRGSALTSLSLDGRSGLTLFDRCWPLGDPACGVPPGPADQGTPDSEDGLDFLLLPPGTPQPIVTYSRQVALDGTMPVGDLWYALSIEFPSGLSGNWTFEQDTDNAIPIPQTPEPSSSLLIVLGLVSLVFTRRRGARDD